METSVIKFTNSHLHLSYKLAPFDHYIPVYDTCSKHWIFLYLSEGQMWHLSSFKVGLLQAFPFPVMVSVEWSQSKFAFHW